MRNDLLKVLVVICGTEGVNKQTLDLFSDSMLTESRKENKVHFGVETLSTKIRGE